MSAEKPTSPAADASELDPQSLAAIRNLLASEPEIEAEPVAEPVAERAARRQAASQAAEQAAVTPVAAPKAKTRRGISLRPKKAAAKAAAAPEAAPKRSAAVPRLETPKAGMFAGLKERLIGYRPSVKHIVVAGLLLLVFFRPWLVVGLLFISLFIMTAVFLIMGYDGFWHGVMRLARWYGRKRPERAGHLQRKLDRFALKFDAFLDWFPEGTVDGLYLPDFGEMATADARHDEALDRRFDNLRESGA